MAGGPWGLLTLCCLCGLLTFPALLVASVLFPAMELRIASRTIVVEIQTVYRPQQVLMGESGPTTLTPARRLLLDGRPRLEEKQGQGPQHTVVVLENLQPGPHTLVLEARAGRHTARHTVRFHVVEAPTPWKLRFIPREARPLFWDVQNRAWGRAEATLFGWLRIPRKAIQGLSQERLQVLRGMLAYVNGHGAMTLYLPDGTHLAVPTYRFRSGPEEHDRLAAGWYEVLSPREASEDIVAELRAVIWEDAPFPTARYLPARLREPEWVTVGPQGVYVFYDAYALGLPAVFFLDTHHPESSQLWPLPASTGKWAGPGFWLTTNHLYHLVPAQGWKALPRFPAVYPKALQKALGDIREDLFLTSTVHLEIRPCGEELWVSAAWELAHGLWAYMARYHSGEWQLVSPPTATGRFFLYCLQDELWTVNAASSGEAPEPQQAQQWGWHLNRTNIHAMLLYQGRGRTYRRRGQAWEAAIAPPLVHPWTPLPHPNGAAMRLFDPDRDGDWVMLPIP